jgi:hypothetical protein
MRQAAGVRRHSLANDHVSVMRTDQGEAALAALRKLGLELELDKDPALAPVTLWLAVNFGPDMVGG